MAHTFTCPRCDNVSEMRTPVGTDERTSAMKKGESDGEEEG